MHRLGVRADQMGGFEKCLGLVALDSWHADIKAGTQEISTVGQIQVDLGIDRKLPGELDLALRCGELYRLRSSRPSLLLAVPLRPLVVCVLPLKTTLSLMMSSVS
jgi:hypothetical protein